MPAFPGYKPKTEKSTDTDICHLPQDVDEGPVIAHPYTKERLLKWGIQRVDAFCKANKLPQMLVVEHNREDYPFDACAYWRKDTCNICVPLCARVASEAQTRNWNWPGCCTDRTPYGVVCHELGHHADVHASIKSVGSYFGEYSRIVRSRSKEKQLTSYCPNYAEWFAEMFRLFVNNHSLLSIVRPRTWEVLMERWIPVSDDDWMIAIGKGCPDRIIQSQLKR